MKKAVAGQEPFSLEKFFDERFELNSRCHVQFGDVVDFYLEWAEATGSPAVPAIAFVQFMESKGCDRTTKDGQVYFSSLSFTRLSPIPRHRWDDETRALAQRILALTPEDLPQAPFEFRQGEMVPDTELFLKAFQREIRCGEDHPRSRTGVLQDEMQVLWKILNSERGGDGLENSLEHNSITEAEQVL